MIIFWDCIRNVDLYWKIAEYRKPFCFVHEEVMQQKEISQTIDPR